MRTSQSYAATGALIIVALLLASATPTLQVSAPQISSITVVDSQTLRLTGSGFGSKAVAAPMKWDNFESGAVGTDVGNGWYVQSSAGNNPKYTNDVLRTGSTRSVKQDFTTNAQYNATVGLAGIDQSRLYVSFWKYGVIGGTGPSRNYKLIAFRGGAPGEWGLPNGRHDIYPVSVDGHIYTTDCNGAETDPATNVWHSYDLTSNRWQRFEYSIDMGTPGVANGSYYWWLDGTLKSSFVNKLVRTSSCTFHNIFVNSYFATDTNGAAAYFWLDDIYIDNTPARVEVCDSSRWSSRQHCEVQIPLSWSGTTSPNTITVTVNRGSFTSTQYNAAYAYVIDANGQVSAPLRVTPGPPAAPTALRIIR